jgi:hypothetical protein
MKKIFYLAFLLGTSLSVKATNYYLSSSSGNDSNPTCNTPATAWQSISKFNASAANSLVAGDSVLFKWGDEFTGELLVTKSGTSANHIVYSTYGSPDGSPVIKGYATLTGWTNHSGNIYKTTCSTCGSSVNSVTVDNQPYAMGRYPNTNNGNKGYNNFEAHSGTTTITDDQLTGTWSSGEVVIRSSRYTIDRLPISSQSGTTLTYSGSITYEPTNKFGYFIQKNLNTLDQMGEWYYNSTTKEFYMDFGGNTPSSYDVRASVTTNLINISGRSYIDIMNLSFEQSNAEAIKIYNSSHLYLLWNQILNAGTHGIAASSSSDIDLVGNYISGSNGNSIDYQAVTGSEVSYNEVVNTALFTGMGLNGTSKSIGIKDAGGSGNTIFFNRVENTGYIGILFGGNNETVSNNFVQNYTVTKDDGGGIYTWTGTGGGSNTGRVVEYNTILNGVGAPEGTQLPGATKNEYSCGLYLDDKTSGVTARYNSIAHVAGDGIYFHMANNITCSYNTVFDCNTQLRFGEDQACCEITGNTVTNNIAVARTTSQLAAYFSSYTNNINTFYLDNTFNNNYYCRPFDDKLTISSNYSSTNLPQDLSMWQAYSGMDGSSNKSPLKYYPYVVNSTTGVEKVTNPSFDSPAALGMSFWAPSGTFGATRDNTSQITGTYSAKVEYSGGSAVGIATVPVGDVIENKKYVLNFKMKGVNSNKTVRVYLEKNGSPFTKLSDIVSFKLTNAVTSNDVLFTANASQPARITIEIDQNDGTVYFDDVSLFEVGTVTINEPNDYIKFVYNETDAAINTTLSGSYKDVSGTSYSGTVSIPAFSSKIFLKVSGSYKPTGIKELAFAKEIALYPNPSNGLVNIVLPSMNAENTEIQIFDFSGRLVSSKAVQLNSAEQTVQVDASNFTAGMYFIKVATSEGMLQKKFVKID